MCGGLAGWKFTRVDVRHVGLTLEDDVNDTLFHVQNGLIGHDFESKKKRQDARSQRMT